MKWIQTEVKKDIIIDRYEQKLHLNPLRLVT